MTKTSHPGCMRSAPVSCPYEARGALTSSRQCRPLLPRKGGGTTGGQRVAESCPHPVLPADEGTSHVQKNHHTHTHILRKKIKGFFFFFFSALGGICSGSPESLNGTGSWENQLGIRGSL